MDLTRGNVFLKKVIFTISFLLLANISHASAAENTAFLANKDTAIEAPKKKSAPLNSLLKPKPDSAVSASENIDEALQSNTHIGVSNYLQMILGLFGVVAFIFFIAWLAKRMGALNSSHSANLKVVAGLNVGHREKIIVIQVMNKQLLIGVTQTNIQLLSELDEPISEASPPSFGSFQEKLQTAIVGLKTRSSSAKSSASDFREGGD
ncbi:hypothetical protein MNBD_GAMMA23-2062 [hydrothermal vent metagenome]|uniref:Flagellar protein n=1 Tax=hydrothermal vent metagenome TaxID=652676 RepID=A0A3B1ALA6_9ZZZZ